MAAQYSVVINMLQDNIAYVRRRIPPFYRTGYRPTTTPIVMTIDANMVTGIGIAADEFVEPVIDMDVTAVDGVPPEQYEGKRGPVDWELLTRDELWSSESILPWRIMVQYKLPLTVVTNSTLDIYVAEWQSFMQGFDLFMQLMGINRRAYSAVVGDTEGNRYNI